MQTPDLSPLDPPFTIRTCITQTAKYVYTFIYTTKQGCLPWYINIAYLFFICLLSLCNAWKLKLIKRIRKKNAIHHQKCLLLPVIERQGNVWTVQTESLVKRVYVLRAISMVDKNPIKSCVNDKRGDRHVNVRSF